MRGGGQVEAASSWHWSACWHWFAHQAHWYFRSTFKHNEQSEAGAAAWRRAGWRCPGGGGGPASRSSSWARQATVEWAPPGEPTVLVSAGGLTPNR